MAEKEMVTMTDGREVGFAAKKKMIKTVEISEDGQVEIKLDFRNGETRSFVPPTSLQAQFIGHGASQKIGDCIAGVPEVDDCVLAVDKLTEELNKGNWGATRKKSGMAGTSVLIQALVRFTGKTVDGIKEYLKDKTQAEKLALRNNPKVRPIVLEIEAERASKKTGAAAVDTDSMLDELGEAAGTDPAE